MTGGTLKTRLFINEPMTNKLLIDVPGVGETIARILQEKRVLSAEHLYKIWLKLHKEKAKFDKWLKYTCGSSYMTVSADLITNAFEEWHHKYGKEEGEETLNEDASENDRNRGNSIKRHSTDNLAPPKENKKTRPDNPNGSTSATEDGTTENGASEIGANVPASANTSGPNTAATNAPGLNTASANTSGPNVPCLVAHSECGPPTQLIELEVLVTGEGDRHLNETQTAAVNCHLEESILVSAKEPNTRAPRFKDMCIINGALQISCEDPLSLEWLERAIANAPEIEGTKITLRRKSELSKKFKVALFIPDYKNTVSDTVLLLTRQNEWAQIATWSKHLEVVKDSSLYLEFSVPQAMASLLLEKGGQLAYKFGSVALWLNASDIYQLTQNTTTSAAQ